MANISCGTHWSRRNVSTLTVPKILHGTDTYNPPRYATRRRLSSPKSWSERLKRTMLRQRTVTQLLLFLLAYGLMVMLTSFATSTTTIHLYADNQRNHSTHRRALSAEQTADGVSEASRAASNTSLSKDCYNRFTVAVKQDGFQPVDESRSYIYSAYLDKRDPKNKTVRIIGIAQRYDRSKYYCLFKYNSGRTVSVPAVPSHMFVDKTLHANFRYQPVFFNCFVESILDPEQVSLTTTPCAWPTNILSVTKVERVDQRNIPDKIGVCHRTLHSIRSPYLVTEFMEVQRELGVDKVFLYGTESVTPEVQKVLEYYQKINFLEMLPWSLPVKNAANFWDRGDIAIHGQRASNNDCLYRNMNKYKLLLMHDFDELFIPRKTRDIRSLVSYLNKELAENTPTASYDFTNCYFCLYEKEVSNTGPQLITTTKKVRDDCMPRELAWTLRHHPELRHKEVNRTVVKKSLVFADRVLEMGVHGVVESLSGYEKTIRVPPDVAAMHHYKMVQGVECHRLDKTMPSRYSFVLKNRVNLVVRSLGMKEVS